jgi:hypothetical protein
MAKTTTRTSFHLSDTDSLPIRCRVHLRIRPCSTTISSLRHQREPLVDVTQSPTTNHNPNTELGYETYEKSAQPTACSSWLGSTCSWLTKTQALTRHVEAFASRLVRVRVPELGRGPPVAQFKRQTQTSPACPQNRLSHSVDMDSHPVRA